MRRPFGYLLAWALATVVAVTGAWIGLQPLLAATSPELPSRLSAAQLRQAATAPPTVPASVGPAPAAPSPPVRSPGVSPGPGPSTGPAPAATASPGRTPTPGGEREAPEPPSAQPALPVTSQWQRLPDGAGFERTFIVRGGEVVFRASREKVEVVEETANPGYAVSVNRWSRRSVILSFESEEQTSRIWVMWRNQPYAEVTESV